MKNVVVAIIKWYNEKGIGPAYVDKAQRIGIRMADLLEKETFERRLKENIEYKTHTLKACLTKLVQHSMKSLTNICCRSTFKRLCDRHS